MSITNEQMLSWLRKLLGCDTRENITLRDYLQSVPRLESLASIPSGTRCWCARYRRQAGAQIGEGDVRCAHMVETLIYGQAKDGNKSFWTHWPKA